MKHRAYLVALLVLTVAMTGAATLPNGDIATSGVAAVVRLAGLGLTAVLWAYWLREDSAH